MSEGRINFDLKDMAIYKDFMKDTDNFDAFRKRLNSMDLSAEEKSRYENHARKYLVLNLYKKARDIATYMDFERVGEEAEIRYLENSSRMADLNDTLDECRIHAKEIGLSEKLMQDAQNKLNDLVDKRREHYISLSETFRTKKKNGNGNGVGK